MSILSLSLSVCATDRVRALTDRTLDVPQLDLRVETPSIEESIVGMLRHRRWDAAEMSFSAALIAAERDTPPFTLLPIFPSRYFRHSAIFINSESGIEAPTDLRGKRIGVPAYARLAAAVWIRGILEDDYGVRPSEINWVVTEPLPIGSADNIPVALSADISIESAGATLPLDQLLARGEIDALITARLPQPFRDADARIRRLFNSPRDVELDYFRRSGIFPPMHVVVVNRELYEADPWIGPALMRAFIEAKNIALANTYDIDIPRYSLAWSIPYLEEERALLGRDAWSHGVVSNRPTIDKFIEYCHRQGLITHRVQPEDVFPANVLEIGG